MKPAIETATPFDSAISSVVFAGGLHNQNKAGRSLNISIGNSDE
jgi:hypothetical protein